MNDWWDYLEHGTKWQEMKNHKYYARVPAGTTMFGTTKYRYFYSRQEYEAYKNGGQKKSKLATAIADANKAHRENRWERTGSITSAFGGVYTERNRATGKERTKQVTDENKHEFTSGGWDRYKKKEKEMNRKEVLYKANKTATHARVAAKKGALTVKSLLKNLGKK